MQAWLRPHRLLRRPMRSSGAMSLKKGSCGVTEAGLAPAHNHELERTRIARVAALSFWRKDACGRMRLL